MLLVVACIGLMSCSQRLHEGTVGQARRADKIVAALHDASTRYVVVVAHRGDWRNYPENSIPAIESVIRMGVDVMELDVKMTRDSVLVLSHDWTLNRTTTGSGNISDYTYEQLLAFDLKRGHGIAIPGLKIPTLRQALEVCKDRIVVNVDQGFDYYDQVVAGGSDMTTFNSYLASPEAVPIAFELCFDTLDDNVKNTARRVLDAGSKVWVNTIWGSLCGDHDDDRAYDSPEPDKVYGPILDLGTSIIQTDRPEFLIKYLEKKGRRRF